jgi:signal transduction histidine kinase/CheY-like chemotaxis protein
MGAFGLSETDINRHAKAAGGLALAAAAVFGLTTLAMKATDFSGGRIVIWPVEGATLALMLGPVRTRPFLVLFVTKLAAICAAVAINSTWLLATSMSVATAICTGALYVIMARLVAKDKFTDSKSLMIFLATAACASIWVGLAESLLYHFILGYPLFKLLLTGAASNAVGYSVVTPLVLILSSIDLRSVRTRKTPIGARWVIGAYCLAVIAIFAQTKYPLLYPIPLGLMLVAYTADLAVVALVVTFTVATTLVFTLMGYGPINITPGDPASHIVMLQLFLAIITATTFPIAALMAEHQRLKRSLIAARTEAEAANQAKSAFLATISHEIRTPLNGVLGMAQVMAMDELSPPQRERIEVVRRSGETLLSLLNDVLDLSKIEAGKIVLETLDFDLGQLLAGALGNYTGLAREKDLTLALEMRAAQGLYRGDPTRLRQILYNLISNALKFTETGGVTLTASSGADGLKVSVADTGMGIPADKVDKLFSKFSQVDESTTRRFGGTGLGLSICRQLAELMGGSIAVETREGLGSTFTLRLPFVWIGPSVAQADAVGAEPAAVQTESLRVLAAEDNATNRLVLKTLLEFGGVDLLLVEDGAQAVEAWRSGEWDLILMDVQMPVMDGPTATRQIRAMERATDRPRTPIVALTANTMSHQIGRYLDAGMDAHLAKPIVTEELFRVLTDAAVLSEQSREDPFELGAQAC